jgi:ubiquinol-cytochrome c reductase cytochrome c1 subunit
MVPAGIDNQGAMITKPGTPASTFRAPFVSEDAAREVMNGSLPPDLSLIVKTYPNGPSDLYGLLTGYTDPPAGVTMQDGMSYNKYFPGHQIAMPPPLNEGQFTYKDGTLSTVAQNASDVVTFLAWAADPHMDSRKELGVWVVFYFLVMAGLTYALKQKIWANVPP